MNRIRVFILMSVLMLLASGCRSEIDFVEGSFRPGSAEVLISGGDLSINFTSDAGSASIDLDASKKWTATFVNDRAKDWCILSTESGKRGTATITVSVVENKEYDQRSASILFTCGDAQRTIVVTQKQKDALLLTSKRQDVGKDGGRITVEVKANVDFKYEIAESAKSWLKPIGTKGLTSSFLLFEVSANEEVEKREGTITITSTLGSETVHVYQEGATPTLILTQNEYTVSDAGGEIGVEIQSNVHFEYEIIEGSDWISEIETKAMSTHTLWFQVIANDTYDERTGIIRIFDKTTDLSEDVTIIQKQKDALLLTQRKYIVSAEGGSFDVEVRSNIDFGYSITEGADWISDVKTKGLEKHILSFQVQCNETDDERLGTIIFSDKKSDLCEEVSIVQRMKDTLIISQQEFSLSEEGGSISFDIRLNRSSSWWCWIPEGSKWIIASDAEIADTDRMYRRTLKYEILKNPSYLDRKGIISFGIYDSGIEQFVTIHQEGNPAVDSTEEKALVAIWEACTDESWKENYRQFYNWASGLPLSEWEGIELNSDGRVVSIDLDGFVGTLPAVISDLKYLQSLDLDGFSGNLDAIGGIENLRLIRFTGGNTILDAFPDVICNCLKLEEIELSGGAASNIFSIPDEIKNLKILRRLYLNPCSVSVIPEAVCELENLEELTLSGGGISHLPSSFGKLQKLRVFECSQHSFTAFPMILCSLTNLEEIDLSHSYSMTGNLPGEIGNLKKLYRLDLFRTCLSGPLPESVFSLPCWKCFPVDLIHVIDNKFECKATDFIAPDFDVYATDGSHLVSRDVYRNHRYTLLYSTNPETGSAYDQAKEVYSHYPEDVEIVFFSVSGNDYIINNFIDSHQIEWPCVQLTKEQVISGYAGHWSLWGKTTADQSIMIVDQKGDVVFFGSGGCGGGFNDIDDAYAFLSGQGYYESEDYSQDGKVINLQTATAGKGIDLVFMGDGYSDRLIADGTYLADMQRAMEAFFEEEPYKSFRHLFNAYAVVAVSKNDRYDKAYGTETAFSVDVTGDGGLSCNNIDKVRDYAAKAFGGDKQRLNHATVTTVINSYVGRSVCHLGNPFNGSSPSLAFCVKKPYVGTLEYLIKHEACGHGFGGLADEYVDAGIVSPDNYDKEVESLKSYLPRYHRDWLYMNIDVTNDPTKVVWAKFLKDPRYTGLVGIYEGGHYVPKGVFRPAENSIMDDGKGEFNAPSREAIYYRIHKMAYGDAWEYDFEKFAEYDVINRNAVKPMMQSAGGGDEIDIRKITAPPVRLQDDDTPVVPWRPK